MIKFEEELRHQGFVLLMKNKCFLSQPLILFNNGLVPYVKLQVIHCHLYLHLPQLSPFYCLLWHYSPPPVPYNYYWLLICMGMYIEKAYLFNLLGTRRRLGTVEYIGWDDLMKSEFCAHILLLYILQQVIKKQIFGRVLWCGEWALMIKKMYLLQEYDRKKKYLRKEGERE